ncbi:MAG: hypothetical protein BRC29_01245 [Nanohaloarchaea archaeon SW_7_43_1]|nr:MAG: hypothetical protein BRC29_01245 [Nanohaloarchaea archaeon SW_7_43_1]
MLSSLKEKLSGDSESSEIEESEVIDDIKEEVSTEDQEVDSINGSLENVDELEKEIEEKLSELNNSGQDSAPQTENGVDEAGNSEESEEVDNPVEKLPETVEEEQNKENFEKPGAEDSIELETDAEDNASKEKEVKNVAQESDSESLHKPSLPGAGNNPDLPSQVKQFEEHVIAGESEELARINDLEQRIEKMELRSTKDLQERIQSLESRIDSMQSVEKFNKRLLELEEVVADNGPAKVDEIGRKVDQLWEAFDEELDDIEKNEDRTDKKIRLLWQALDLKTDELESLIENNDERKIEELWEAMDEELMDVESRIHENKEEINDLYSSVVELSELMKKEVEYDH